MTAKCAGCGTNFKNKGDLLNSSHGREHAVANKLLAERNWQQALEALDKHRKVHHLCTNDCDKEVNATYSKKKRAETEFKLIMKKFGDKS